MSEYQDYTVKHFGSYIDSKPQLDRSLKEKIDLFVEEENLFIENSVANVKVFYSDMADGKCVAVKFTARKRTNDDDVRERIEYMIENLTT